MPSTPTSFTETATDLDSIAASQLINTEWVQPGIGVHKMFSGHGDISDAVGHPPATAYALLRPDAQWALMPVNRDQENTHKVHSELMVKLQAARAASPARQT